MLKRTASLVVVCLLTTGCGSGSNKDPQKVTKADMEDVIGELDFDSHLMQAAAVAEKEGGVQAAYAKYDKTDHAMSFFASKAGQEVSAIPDAKRSEVYLHALGGIMSALEPQKLSDSELKKCIELGINELLKKK